MGRVAIWLGLLAAGIGLLLTALVLQDGTPPILLGSGVLVGSVCTTAGVIGLGFDLFAVLARRVGLPRQAVERPSPSITDEATVPDLIELTKTKLTNRVLDEAYNTARQAADQQIADDADFRLDDIGLTDPPIVSFMGSSVSRQSEFRLSVVGDRVAVSEQRRSHPLAPYQPAKYVRPWRQNKTWLQLVRQSWVRVRPVVGSAVLAQQFATPEVSADRTVQEWRWRVTYRRRVGGLWETQETYVLVDGEAQLFEDRGSRWM